MGVGRKVWLVMSACAALLPAVPAEAGDLPPPQVRRSTRRVAPAPARSVTRRVVPRAAPRVAPAPARTSATPSRARSLPYQLPYRPPQRLLPVSSPTRAATSITAVPPSPRTARTGARQVPATPRRAAPRRPSSTASLPQPKVRAALPVWGPPAAPAAGRRVVPRTSTRVRTPTSAPRRQPVPCRTVPRRVPVRRFDLAVPCAPGQPPPPKPTRCRLPFVLPFGCTDDG